MIRFAGFVTVAGFSSCLWLPATVLAQTEISIRVAPEVAWLSVEHSKRVTAGGGSSESTSGASDPTFAVNPSVGVRTGLPRGLLAAVELEGLLANQGTIEGTIRPTPNGEPHDVWPGEWDLRDRFGLGGNVLFGFDFRDGAVQGYAFAGIRRVWTEFATSGVNPATGETGERRERRARWPSTLGIGLTLSRSWLIDIRVGYARSLTEWSVEIPDVLLDYGYSASGLTLSAGIGPPR